MGRHRWWLASMSQPMGRFLTGCISAIMVPAGPSVLWKMATPRRYTDKDYMSKVAPEIYGGDFRKNPSLIGAHASAMRGAGNLGYLYQLLAMTGWTSLPWLWSLPQPTLILMGSDD